MAPHVVNGEVMGPYHHYCKVISPEPIIQCILFESVLADAPMTEVEYIVAKSLTRNLVDREQWNVAWHDHAVEIASGRVQVLDMSKADAQAVVDVVNSKAERPIRRAAAQALGALDLASDQITPLIRDAAGGD